MGYRRRIKEHTGILMRNRAEDKETVDERQNGPEEKEKNRRSES